MSSNIPRNFGDFGCCDMTCSICDDEDFVKFGDQYFMNENKKYKIVDLVEISKLMEKPYAKIPHDEQIKKIEN